MLDWGRIQAVKTFYAKGYFWLFYTDADAKTYFRTSKDGFTWSDATLVRTASAAYFSVTVDDNGDYVHYAFAQGDILYYRRGKLNSDGTITWDTEQSLSPLGGYYPNIILDSDGYPWIGLQKGIERKPYVTKSSTKDGTWTTADGFPYKLSDISGDHVHAVPLRLSGSKVYVYYWNDGTPVYGQLWDGSWGTEETASTSYVHRAGALARVDKYDNIHCIIRKFVHDSIYNLIHVRRDASTSTWSSETVIAQLSGTVPLWAFCIDLDTGYLYVFYHLKTDTIYLCRYDGEAWTIVDWITGEDVLNEITSFTKKFNRENLVVWSSGASAPYKLRCHVYGILPSILKSNIHTL
jgi:hypothetical protein